MRPLVEEVDRLDSLLADRWRSHMSERMTGGIAGATAPTGGLNRKTMSVPYGSVPITRTHAASFFLAWADPCHFVDRSLLVWLSLQARCISGHTQRLCSLR